MNDQYKEIVETGKRMVAQSNRGTQYPLFVIQQDVRHWVAVDEDYNERQRTEEIKEYWLCDSCSALHGDDKELPPECEKCDEDAFDHYEIKQEFVISSAGVFFTEEACHKHIRENMHHYRNPQSYVICAWRNPEMVNVMQQIIKTSDQEIPSHYA
jgi:hypothetical protein